jgi:histidyl-tRNA synthetase
LYKAPRGTSDILPEEQPYWGHVRRQAESIAQLHGYGRIDTPAFEDAGLFQRSIGDATDIVEKETYTFEDRSGDMLTLRPEGTASVCRAYIEHGMHTLPQPVRLYYFADIFRYERPQAGRYRQHHQFGVEALGDTDPALDAEAIAVAWHLCANLGLRALTMNLNSIGCGTCRPRYLESLRGYYSHHTESLCPDCKRRLSRNALRLLDCKQPSCVPLTERAPQSIDYLCNTCAEHFNRLKRYLNVLGLPFFINHRLVRGLDYYTKTVFEIAPEGELVAQATIAAGGRYDDLIGQLGGRPTPAVGFATGIERLVLNVRKQGVPAPPAPSPAVFIAYLGEEAKAEAIGLASRLRASGVSTILSFGDRSLKAQLKQANSAGMRCTVIIGEDEVRSGSAVLRDMEKGDQETIPLDRVAEVLERTATENGLC